MKIIGFVYHNDRTEMVLKGDSCLLNGNKPFFMPDWTQEFGVSKCLILRVSRLGKEIGMKFAGRYYDAVACGADFEATRVLREAQAEGRPWTTALAFDYSLAIGEWIDKEDTSATDLLHEEWMMSPEEAVAEASKVMTIRQGDLIYIRHKGAPVPVHKEQILSEERDGKQLLYCKIK